MDDESVDVARNTGMLVLKDSSSEEKIDEELVGCVFFPGWAVFIDYSK